jgi:hypothetical protein
VTVVELLLIALRCIDKGGCIEVFVVFEDEVGYWAFHGFDKNL